MSVFLGIFSAFTLLRSAPSHPIACFFCGGFTEHAYLRCFDPIRTFYNRIAPACCLSVCSFVRPCECGSFNKYGRRSLSTSGSRPLLCLPLLSDFPRPAPRKELKAHESRLAVYPSWLLPTNINFRPPPPRALAPPDFDSHAMTNGHCHLYVPLQQTFVHLHPVPVRAWLAVWPHLSSPTDITTDLPATSHAPSFTGICNVCLRFHSMQSGVGPDDARSFPGADEKLHGVCGRLPGSASGDGEGREKRPSSAFPRIAVLKRASRSYYCVVDSFPQKLTGECAVLHL